MFNPIIFALTPSLAADVGVTDPQRQTFFGILGGVMGTPLGLGVTLALAAQEGQQNTSNLVPQLSAIAPATGVPGQSVQVTITGTNFRVGAQIVSDNPAVTAGNIVVVSDKQITATLLIAVSAGAGTANIAVTTLNGKSLSQPFTIALAAPILQSVSPATGAPGQTVHVTLTGSNFTPDATIGIAAAAGGAGSPSITVSNPVVVSTTQITADFVISPQSPAGNVVVTVKTASGTSGQQSFAIATSTTPQITSISPSSLPAGQTSPVLITGSGFIAGATMSAGTSAPLSISNVTVLGATQILATFTATSTGSANITVTTSVGTSAPVSFVIGGAPTLTSVSPTSVAQGDSNVDMTLTGTNFISPVTVNFSDPQITINGTPSITSDKGIHLNCNIGDTASTGTSNVTVTTSAGTSGPGSFTIEAKAPKLESAIRAKERGAAGR